MVRCFPRCCCLGFVRASLRAHGRDRAARVVASHGYEKAVELTRGTARAVLCPEIGGRVLEFSVGGKHAMWFDEAERNRQPGEPPSSAGRFDFGPEMTTPRHRRSGPALGPPRSPGDRAARLTSQKDDSSGVQLTRDFELCRQGERVPLLVCKQTITNISDRAAGVLPLGPLVFAGRRHLPDSAGGHQPLSQQVRPVRRGRPDQREGDRRADPRARRLPRNPRPAAEAQAGLRLLRRLAGLCDARRSAVREAVRDLSRPRL